MQKIIFAAVLLLTALTMLASGSSNSVSDTESNAGVSFDHRRWSWGQWNHPTVATEPTTRRAWKPWTKRTRKLKPKTTLAPTPGPEICQNHTKVSSVDEEPGKVVCLRRNSTELLTQLRSVGGLIERYMAVNVSQACGFQDLTNFIDEGPMIRNPPPDTTTPPTSATTTRSTVRNPADEQTESDETLERRKRSIPSTPGTIIRGCQGRGTIPDGTDLRRLCTECAGTTRLADDRYPTYINEVICRDRDRQCAARMGVCSQRQLRLPFLQLTGGFERDTLLSQLTGKTVYKEVWVPYTQEIRSCCECRVYNFVYQTFATRSRG